MLRKKKFKINIKSIFFIHIYLLTGAGTFFIFWTKSSKDIAGSQDLSREAVATTFLLGSASKD